MMSVSTEALDLVSALCRRFEGCRLRPYLCPAGVPTIGYGSTRYLDGRVVQLTDAPISMGAAVRLLERTVQKSFMPAVMALCPAIDSAERLAAITDLAYNIGLGNLRASTLRRKVNAGDWAAVPSELRKWCYASGKRLNGLVARRAAEAELI
jgi:lysozyme